MKLTELITAIHALYVRLHAGEVAAWRELEMLCMQTPAESAPAILASPHIQTLLPALRVRCQVGGGRSMGGGGRQLGGTAGEIQALRVYYG